MEGQPENRLAIVPQLAVGPDRAPSYIAFGGMTVDNVITADGHRLIGVCGGNALYSAVGMRVWADDVGIVARVGDDYPHECIEAAAGYGLDLHGLRRLNGPHRLRVAFAYRADGSRTRTVTDDMLEGVPLAERHHFQDTTFDDSTYLSFSPVVADIPDGWLASAKGMHLPALRFVTHRAVTAHVRDVNPSLTLTMDSPWYEGGDVPGEDLATVLHRVSVVLPRADDLRAVWPALGPLEAAKALRHRGARAAVVKVGGLGRSCWTRQGLPGRYLHSRRMPLN
jgi:ribokinase